MFRSKLKTIFLAASVTLLSVSLIIFPEESFDASIRGLNMWWEIVFPSLLPFFIMAELLIGFGVVKFIGVILEPLMRPLFRVPGVGGFVWAMGMASGYPAGAKLTTRLRQEKQLTKIEAERLLSFTNSSNPLFIFGAVAVGFFKNAQLGIILALAHYLGNMSVGLFMRFYGRDEEEKQQTLNKKTHLSLKKAFASLHETRLKDNRPIGKLLGDAVISSIHTLLMIGGFIILFSVINKLLFHLQITSLLAKLIEGFFYLLQLPVSLSLPFISGLFEITLGSQLTSQVQETTLLQQAMMVSFILAFSGFSVHAQIASIVARTDIRFQPYFFARIMHGFFASCYTFLLWNPIYVQFFKNEQPSNAVPVLVLQDQHWLINLYSWLIKVGPLITVISLMCYVLIYTKRILFIK